MTVKLKSIEAGKTEDYIIWVKVDNFIEDADKYTIGIIATASVNDVKYRADIDTKEIEITHFSIVQTSSTEGEKLNPADDIEYNFVIKIFFSIIFRSFGQPL